jgi:hypothetical protein
MPGNDDLRNERMFDSSDRLSGILDTLTRRAR